MEPRRVFIIGANSLSEKSAEEDNDDGKYSQTSSHSFAHNEYGIYVLPHSDATCSLSDFITAKLNHFAKEPLENVNKLEIPKCSTDLNCMKALELFIQSKPMVTTLELAGSCSTSNILLLERLSTILSSNQTLRTLRLRVDEAQIFEWFAIVCRIVKHSLIQEVLISEFDYDSFAKENLVPDKSITKAEISLIHHCLKNHSKSIHIQWIHEWKTFFVELFEMIGKGGGDDNDENLLSSVETIDFPKTLDRKFGSSDFACLCDVLISHRIMLKKLDISHLLDASSDPCVMESLGKYLKFNSKLEVLNMSNTDMTDDCIDILSEHLTGHMFIRELVFNKNKMTNLSFPSLCAMAATTHVQTMDLDENDIEYAVPEQMEKLQALLAIPPEQREIPVLSNTKSAAKKRSRDEEEQ